MELSLKVVRYREAPPSEDLEASFGARGGVIGREFADLILDDDIVSSLHAEIDFEDENFFVTDRSRNGTFLLVGDDGTEPEWKDIGEQRLQLFHDDLLLIGEYEIRVNIVESSRRAAPCGPRSDAPTESRVKGDTGRNPPPSPPPPGDADTVPDAALNGNGHPPGEPVRTGANGLDADAPPAPPPGASEQELLAAFLRGAGLDENFNPDKPLPELMNDFGKLLFVVVDSLQRLLDARVHLRNEFGLDETRFRHGRNNPLKFGGDPSEIIRQLILQRSGMSAQAAVTEAFKNISDHEKAAVEGFKSALLDLLNEFDPQFLDEHFDSLPSSIWGKSYRNWKQYQLFYETKQRGIQESLRHNSLARAFARGYEQRIAALRSPRGPDESRRRS